MITLSDVAPLDPKERASFGVARAKSIAFDAVHALWRRRRAEGRSQADLARTLDKDEGWLSKNLRGPGNWTMRTFGELVEALDGDLEIVVHAIEDPLPVTTNSHAYAGYDFEVVSRTRPAVVRVQKDSNFLALRGPAGPMSAASLGPGPTGPSGSVTSLLKIQST